MSGMPVEATAPSLAHEERAWGVFCHLSLLVGLGVLGPWAVGRWVATPESALARHAREALNYQITFYVYAGLCGLLVFVVIGIFLLPGLALVGGWLAAVAAWRTSQGAPVHYPMSIRFFP